MIVNASEYDMKTFLVVMVRAYASSMVMKTASSILEAVFGVCLGSCFWGVLCVPL